MATERTEQIVREAPEIEAYKLGLLKSAQALQAPTLPDYQVAGMTQDQINALATGRQGIGAYQPYLTAGSQALTAGQASMGEAADILRGADTRGQFTAAQQAYDLASVPAAALGNLSNVAGSGMGYIGQGSADIDRAQQMAEASAQANLSPYQNLMSQSVGQAQQAVNQPGFQQGVGTALSAAQQAQMAAAQPGFQQAQQTGMQSAQAAMAAANQPGFGQAQGALQTGIGALQGAAQAYDPSSAQGFMNPYQQQVIDEAMRQIDRQGAIQQQGLNAQAVRAGAFGGSREGIQQQELNRNLSETKNAAIISALQQGYGTSQQQAQQAFEQQQQRQLAQAQGFQGAAGQAGSLAAQQAGLQQQGAQALAGQAGLQASIAAQQAGLGQNAAQQLAQAGQMQASTAAQQAGLGMQAAQYAGSVGQNIGAQNLQQAALGQQAAQNIGQMGATQAGLAGQYSNIASQQAGILGQQSQLQQSLGQGIGNLANQQFGIGQGMATGIAGLGSQLGNLGVQQAALGQQQQALAQGDTNFLYNLGSTQQRQSQAELDALRASKMQTALQPMQQLAFVSDIYKGAPSTQMAVTQQQQPTPSPFQQIAGLATGTVGALAAGKSAGII